jgi:VWFA-related protein
MLLFWLALLAAADPGGPDAVYYFNLNVKAEPSNQVLKVTAEPKQMISYDLIKDPDLNVPAGFAKAAYDAPLHELAMVLPILDSTRRKFMRRANKAMPLVKFRVMLTARRSDGKELSDLDYTVEIGLAKKPGQISIHSKYGDLKVSSEKLMTSAGYEDFLQKAIMPFGQAKLELPKDDQFLVDLYIGWPKPSSRKSEKLLRAAWPPLMRFSALSADVFRLHLGTTSCLMERGELKVWRSEHQKLTSEIVDNLRLAHEAFQKGNWVVSSLRYQDHLRSLPADRLALRNLVFSKLEMTQPRQALQILDRNEMLWKGDGELLDIRNQLRDTERILLEQHLADPDAFTLTREMQVSVISPERGDLVGGDFVAKAMITGMDCDILIARATLNGKVIGQTKQEPLVFPIKRKHLKKGNLLKIQVFFEDGTTDWAETAFRGTNIGENMMVNLVTLRTLVNQDDSKILSNLTRGEFELSENGQVKPLKDFSMNQAPLRVAIVLDTSMSMNGRKLFNALHATTEFVSNLEEEDTAAVYTFDPWVMRWNDFSKRHSEMVHEFQTVSPRLATSLYDAIYVAHQDLLQQEGTRVLIVVSDGQDSNSQIQPEDVRHLLSQSSVIFYPVVISADEYHGRKGVALLEEFALLTGSVAQRVPSDGRIGDSFSGIYKELKSFYLLQYYSNQEYLNTDNIQIKVHRLGAEARFRPFVGPTADHLIFSNQEPLQSSTVN